LITIKKCQFTKIFYKNILCVFFFSACFFCVDVYSQTWNKVGAANYTNPVYGLNSINNKLYVGGDYSTSPRINMAIWDSSIWIPFDSTDYGDVYCFLKYNNDIYIGGKFTMSGSVNTSGIAKWNGSVWSTVGGGLSAAVYSVNDLEVFNGEIYAAGKFPSIGGVNTKGIAKWNGSNWIALSGGLSGGFPTPDGNALVYYKNDLYVGGDFTMAGNIPANYVARWNGAQWDSVGKGTNGEVLAFVVDTINDFLYAGGRMFKGNARWDGFTWTTLDSGISGNIYSLTIYHNQLYAVGYITAIGGEGVARWNGVYWEAVGGGTTSGGNTVFSCEVYKDELYVGGGFTDAGGDTNIKWIARWYSPLDSNCNFLQPIIYGYPPGNKSAFADTFYYTDSVAVEFYNNIANSTSWVWDFGDGDTGIGQTPIHYYTAAGTYTVSVIVNYPWGPNGPCIDTTYKTVTIIYGISGVNELQQNLKFKVYPNPAKNKITVETTENKKFIVKISNSQGKQIIKQSFQRKTEVDVSSYGKGLLLVEVCDEKGVKCHTKKILIE